MKKLIQLFLGILIVACSSGVHAQCKTNGGVLIGATYSPSSYYPWQFTARHGSVFYCST
jgi:hypothetical protein